MVIRGRVGRHAQTNKHCQNWKADQVVVVSLLNGIPVAEGGSEGLLAAPIIAGFASQQLFTAILYFQKKHFPGTPTGFVEPGGSMLAKLEALAAKPAPPPSPSPKSDLWDNVKDPAFRKELQKAMASDNQIDYDEAIEIVRHLLSDGLVSAAEIDDLEAVALHSKSIPQAARDLFKSFVVNLRWEQKHGRSFRLTEDKHKFAADMVCDFLKRSGRIYFPKLNRYDLGVGMLMRIANPGLLNQSASSLCGPAALLFNIANNSPMLYVRFAIDLFEKGSAKLGRLFITPGQDVRNYNPPMAQIDWMTMASIRDSENWFLDYDSVGGELSGVTLPGELADWFRKSGYRDVREDTNLSAAFTKGANTIDEANRLFTEGYSVCLFIGAQMLQEKYQFKKGSIFDRHWIVLRSRIVYSADKVQLTAFTWGSGEYSIPNGGTNLRLSDFIQNFYGYLAAKP